MRINIPKLHTKNITTILLIISIIENKKERFETSLLTLF